MVCVEVKSARWRSTYECELDGETITVEVWRRPKTRKWRVFFACRGEKHTFTVPTSARRHHMPAILEAAIVMLCGGGDGDGDT